MLALLPRRSSAGRCGFGGYSSSAVFDHLSDPGGAHGINPEAGIILARDGVVFGVLSRSASERTTNFSRFFATAVDDQSTVIVTGFDAMPFATTSRTLGPVSIVPGTVKVVELAVPGAIDIVV